MILSVPGAGSHMVSVVPLGVLQTRIVRTVHHDLVLGDAEARPVLVFSGRELEDTLDVLSSQRGVPLVSCHWWSHILEHHHVVSRHLCLFFYCFTYNFQNKSCWHLTGFWGFGVLG